MNNLEILKKVRVAFNALNETIDNNYISAWNHDLKESEDCVLLDDWENYDDEGTVFKGISRDLYTIKMLLFPEEVDLFECLETLPEGIQEIINRNAQDVESFESETCDRLLTELERFGYTFDFGLDYIPYNLKRI